MCITYIVYSFIYNILVTSIDFSSNDYSVYYNNNIYYNDNIFERACPTLGISPTDILNQLSVRNYSKPLSTIIEYGYEENKSINTNYSPQLKGAILVCAHIFIYCMIYTQTNI